MDIFANFSVLVYMILWVYALMWPVITTFIFISVPYYVLPYLTTFTLTYGLFIVLDQNAANTGGRSRGRWLIDWYESICEGCQRYFSMKLVKTADLPPTTNYIFCIHPHGPFGFGVGCSLLAKNMAHMFPKLVRHLVHIPLLSWAPFVREMLLFRGCVSCSRESVDCILKTPPTEHEAKALMILVGGGKEIQYVAPGKMTIVLKHRQGFARMALRHGSALVPVWIFGENNVYLRPQSEIMMNLERKLMAFSKKHKRGFCMMYGRFGTLFPLRRPITTVVGRPIPVKKWTDSAEPPSDVVDQLHKVYCQELTRLYDEHKKSYGYEDVQLEFV